MKTKAIYLFLASALCAALVHEMEWAENRCAELGNTPQECATL